jgi:hypothetical protein
MHTNKKVSLSALSNYQLTTISKPSREDWPEAPVILLELVLSQRSLHKRDRKIGNFVETGSTSFIVSSWSRCWNSIWLRRGRSDRWYVSMSWVRETNWSYMCKRRVLYIYYDTPLLQSTNTMWVNMNNSVARTLLRFVERFASPSRSRWFEKLSLFFSFALCAAMRWLTIFVREVFFAF